MFDVVRVLGPVTCLLLTAATLAGQVRTGVIQGSVRDAQDAIIPGANITVRNQQTNVSRTFVTNEIGVYVIPLLDPGEYAVTAEASGFKKTVREGIVLQVADQLVVDLQLHVGGVAEVVTVEASVPLLNAGDNTLGQVVENRRILDLPLDGRDVFSLSELAPGVLPNPPAAWVHQGGSIASIGGASNFTSEVTVDGMPNTAPAQRSQNSYLIYTPTVDKVEQFRVQTNGLSAEYGRSNGGVVSVVSKTGTNSFHGTLYEFHRNSFLDANAFFNNLAGIPLGSLVRNQFGGTLGGPVTIPRLYRGKDRTFFFFSYEAFRGSVLSESNFTVPTVLERSGDFSRTVNNQGAQIRIYDPLTLTSNAGTFVRSPFPNNVIPRERLSAASTRLAAYYPAPTNSNLVGNLRMSAGRKLVTDTYDGRIDHNFSDRNRLFVRYSSQVPVVGEPDWFRNVASPGGNPLTQRRKSGTIQDTYTINPTLMVNLSYGLAFMSGLRSDRSLGTNITELGFPAYLQKAQSDPVIPQIAISGLSSLATSFVNFSDVGNHTFLGSVVKIKGSHTLKAGLDYRAYYVNIANRTNGKGNFSFGANFTQGPNANQASASAGHALATFLLGIPSSGRIGQPVTLAEKSSYWAGYLQDDWKVGRRVTLNLGIRYDLPVPRTERYDRMVVFDAQATSPIASRVPGWNLRGAMAPRTPDNRKPAPADSNNFAPRLGLAWRVAPSLVVRAGYGIFYGLPPTDATSDTGLNDAFFEWTDLVASRDGVTPIARVEDPFPSGIRAPVANSEINSLTRIGRAHNSGVISMATPYFQQGNFSIQRGLRGDVLLEIAYAVNKGSKTTINSIGMNTLRDEQTRLGTVNQQLVPNPFFGVITDSTSPLSLATVARGQLLLPFPQYQAISAIASSIGSMTYHSMLAKLEKRFSHGFTALVSYTNAKNIGDGSQGQVGPNNFGVSDPYNLRLERSLDSQDVSQRLVISGVLELPIGRGRRLGANWSRPVDALLGGWQVNGIASFQKGLPLLFTTRPNRAAAGEDLSGRSAQSRISRWFDTSVFTVPAAFTRGNMSRTAPDLRTHGINNFDLSMFKTFKPLDKLQVQLRLESFNAFNRVQFGPPGTTIGTTSFGVITTQYNRPRQTQLAAKLIF
jgi:outer membrane receptor protein involved in Fe transport